MPLSEPQQQRLENWMRSKAVVQCPACGDSKWRFAEAAYVRALLEPGEVDLTEAGGVVKVSCDNCGYMALFDAETVGIRGLWDKGRDL
jgi:predicted nucleic-acid-binding Zn-ribbon protein